MATGLSIRLFGPLEVSDGAGRLLDLGTRKQRALIAMLALEPGRVVSLDRLIEELWAGEPPAGATRTLQSYLAHLRKALEPDRAPRTPPRILLTREPGYLLAVTPGQVDLARFTAEVSHGRRLLAQDDHGGARQTLDRALELWRGDPLGEFADQGFAQPVIAQMAELQTVALEDLFEARLALGEAAASVPGLEALVATSPYRERAWGLLVLALYRSGRQADALAALRRVRARLADDLGLQPGPELRELEQAVFDQAPELALPVRERVTGPAPEPPAAADTLVAREAPLLLTERLLAETRHGHGRVMLVSGEAGIGKTRLGQATAEHAAARGFRVAWGRGVDGPAPAFWPWIQVLRDCGDDGSLLSGQVPAPTQDPEAALFERYEQTVAALTAAGGPLLVVLDDVHWADVSSLRLLTFVADAVARHPVLIMVMLRTEPGDHPEELRDTLAALSRQRTTERVELAPFTAADISAYLRSRRLAEDPGLVGALLDRTGGNPFYLREVLRLPDSERGRPEAVPPGARDVIDRRLARLPEETRDLLRAAAVAGREVDIGLLEAVTGTPGEQVMSELEPAVATGLLAEPPSGPDYRFAHALVRQAVYSGLSRLERARLHLRLAEATEAVVPDAEPGTLAHHFALAAKVGGAAKAVEHAARAARRSTAQLAYTEAVQFWKLALASLPPGRDVTRARLLTELGQARRTTGQAEAARRDLDEAIELARRTGDREALLAAATAFGTLTLWYWRPYGQVDDQMVAVVEDLLAGPLDESDRAALLGTLALELHYGPRRAEGERHAVEAVEIARRIGDTPLLARTLNNYLLAAFVPGRNTARRQAAEEMAALPGLPRPAELVARVSRMACLLREGDLAEWDRELARCQRLLDEAHRPELEAMVRIAETARCTLDARWADAEALLTRYDTLQFGSSLWGRQFHRLVTTYTCRRGQGRGEELLDELITTAEQPHLDPLRPLAVLAAAEADRPRLAHELIDRWGTEIRQDWTADFLTPVWGMVAARLGVPDPHDLYEALTPPADLLIVAGMGSAGWGSTHQVLAELADRLGRRDRARGHAHAALRTHRRLGLTHWERQSRQQLTRLS